VPKLLQRNVFIISATSTISVHTIDGNMHSFNGGLLKVSYSWQYFANTNNDISKVEFKKKCGEEDYRACKHEIINSSTKNLVNSDNLIGTSVFLLEKIELEPFF
jgi:hypothetical protein